MSIYSRHITDFNVAGVRYWDGALVLDELKVGANLTMIVEENNPHDPDAVALYWKDTKIGYVPRDLNWLPALLLDTVTSWNAESLKSTKKQTPGSSYK